MTRRLSALLLALSLAPGCSQGGAPSAAPVDEHGAPSDDHDEGVVHLSPAALERAHIQVAPAAPHPIEGGTRVPAEVRLIPQRTAHVAPLVPGRFTRIAVEPGQVVQAGDTLAFISASEVAELRARERQLRARLTAARATASRQRALSAEGAGPARAAIDAQATRRELEAELDGVLRQLALLGADAASGELALTTPIAGTVVEMHATLGERTRDDESPFVVSDPGEVWVVGLVPEVAIAEVVVGQRARLRLHAYPGERWEGVIGFIAPSLDEAARALPVRVHLPNPDGRLRAGLVGTLELLAPTAEPSAPARPAVPISALITLDGRDAVFTLGDHDGEFIPQFVTLGRREEDLVEILDGLAPNASVVTVGAFTLKSALQKDALAEHDN